MASEDVLYENYCNRCELSFDVWVEVVDGRRLVVAEHNLCPNCMSFCRDLHEKEGLV